MTKNLQFQPFLALKNLNEVRIATLGMSGCIASAVTGPADLFAAANIAREVALASEEVAPPRLNWSLAGDGPIKTQAGVTLIPDIDLESAVACDVVIVPGFGGLGAQSRDVVLQKSDPVQHVLRQLDTDKQLVIGLCTGTLILAEAGLLTHKKATTSWWNSAEFRNRYPEVDLVSDQLMTVDGNVVSAGAGASYFDVALFILEQIGGPGLCDTVANYFVLDPSRPSQARYVLPEYVAHTDPVVSKYDRLVREGLQFRWTVADLAKKLGTSTRTLSRRTLRATGLSPLEYQMKVRMQSARQLIISGRFSVDEIAHQVGYADTNAFRRAIKKHFGESVSEIR